MTDLTEFLSNYWYWIVLSVCGSLLMMIGPLVLVWRYKANQRWLKENGRVASAKVLKIWDSGTKIGGGAGKENVVGIGLLLEVYPEGGQPYQVKARDQLHVMDLSRIAPGMMVQVRIHPNNPQKVVVAQWNTVVAQMSPDFMPDTAPDQRLQQLKQLQEAGLITPQEYETKKKEILAGL